MLFILKTKRDRAISDKFQTLVVETTPLKSLNFPDFGHCEFLWKLKMLFISKTVRDRAILGICEVYIEFHGLKISGYLQSHRKSPDGQYKILK